MDTKKGVIPKHDISIHEDLKIDSLKSDDIFEALGTAATASSAARRRYVICIDATSSMGPVWTMAKKAAKQSIDEIKRKASCPIQVRIIAYRDITCDTNFIESSEWSDDTLYLREFIDKMGCQGGGDYPESVDVGLMEALIDRPNQIILIGDAPGRPESPGFKEAEAAGQTECPIFALYTDEDAKLVKNFTRIAKLSGGKAMHLKNLDVMEDILSVLLSSDKRLMITYEPKTLEGKKLLEDLKK